MITFLSAIVLLIGGYLLYSKVVERVFGINEKGVTPAYSMTDGVDYVPMKWGKVFLIQFLNIAGLGPIFGAIMGATFGPAAFLWIVFGSIFGGAVHDYLSGMLSIRHGGLSLHGITEFYLGKTVRKIMSVFTIVLMVLVGAVFIAGPARLLANMTPNVLNFTFWSVAIFLYYFLATMTPIDKLIGRIYPFFGLALIFMAVGILISLLVNHASIPEALPGNLYNMKFQSDKYPLFPMMFISIACGAISGFHATQSPMMARCLTNEKLGRRVFYGAMITEGLVALIWAAAAMSFFGSVDSLQVFLGEHGGNAAVVVEKITKDWLGKTGAILALIGVVAAPITSGDTAFRSGRLILADVFHLDQKPIRKRLYLAVPLFLTGFILLQIDFDIIWRYFAWSNQTLAAITLWVITVALANYNRFFWITLIPAIFMTMVVITYILVAPEGFQLPLASGVWIAAIVSVLASGWFFYKKKPV
jgi:carbon starvation protein CstA